MPNAVDSPETLPASASRPANLAATLRLSIGRTWRRVRAERGTVELPDVQLAILVRLVKDGATTPGAIAEFHGIRPPSATRAVQHLEELGLAVRSEHPTDRRQVLVTVTEAGREEVRETMRRRDAWLARRLAELTPAERELLARATAVLNKIVES